MKYYITTTQPNFKDNVAGYWEILVYGGLDEALAVDVSDTERKVAKMLQVIHNAGELGKELLYTCEELLDSCENTAAWGITLTSVYLQAMG